MSDKLSMGVEVNAQGTLSTAKSNASQTSASTPFCIAILGDFSGRENKLSREPAEKKPLRLIDIDRDNFEAIMASFNINLQLNLSNNESIDIKLNELDDFHPDELYEKLESFSKLRSLHRRLKSTANFADAAAEIQSWLPEATPTENNPAKTTAQNTGDAPASENILDDILSTQQNQPPSNDASNIDKLIKSIVAPYVEPATDPRQDEILKLVDKVTQNHMRDILHHADFQNIESAWQSLYFLIKRLEIDSKLKIFLLDISKQELQEDLSAEDLSSSAVYKLFCDPSAGDTPWSVLLGNYNFSDNINDVLTLANMGTISQKTNAAFFTAADEKLAGCNSFATTPDYEDWNYALSEGVNKAWEMLRQSPAASYVSLALPRFLLRLPYGKKSKPIDTFDFEEMTDENNHHDYLWGNAAFIKVECLAQNFKNNGWNMQPSEVFQTENLPVHYFKHDGETLSKPIAEIMLTEKGGEIISSKGLVSLWSVRNADCIRSSDYRSLNENNQTIVGRWKN